MSFSSAQMPAILMLTAAGSVKHWILHLGAWGLIPLGLLDSSVIPLPGSMDLLTILLCARDGHWWLYYALMATAGSVLGGLVTYRLARHGGEEVLSRRFSPRKLDRVYKIFARSGFAAIAIPAVLPPPAPMVPFLLAAGAMQYPVGKFLAALTLGRLARYTTLAFLAERYGQQIVRFFSLHAVLLGMSALTVIGIAVYLAIRQQARRPVQRAAGGS